MTPDLARETIDGDNPEFKTVSDEQTDSRRWVSNNTWVGQRVSDGLYFSVNYEMGLTENQDTMPFEYAKEVVFKQVFKKEKVVEYFE